MSTETTEGGAKEGASPHEPVNVEKTRRFQKRTSWALAVGFVGVMLTLGGTLRESYRTSQREAGVFASATATAFAQGFCDRALRLAIAGLPPDVGASPTSFRSRQLQGELSFFGSAHDCHFQLALTGHKGLVDSASFSPDGSHVVTSSWDTTARVWDSKTGAALATLSGHKFWVTSAAFSPDGSRIVSASWDKTARVWDAKTGTSLVVLSGHSGRVTELRSALMVLASLRPPTTTRRECGTPRAAPCSPRLSGHEDAVDSAAFSPDGSRAVTASFDGTARVWDAETGAALTALLGHTSWYGARRSARTGLASVTASDDKTARVWDASTGAMIATFSGHRARC